MLCKFCSIFKYTKCETFSTNRKKYPEEELQELFPESNGEFGSEHFSPSWFLVQHHHSTSFEDLKAGLSFLKRRVEAQKEGQISFLKVCYMIHNSLLHIVLFYQLSRTKIN